MHGDKQLRSAADTPLYARSRFVLHGYRPVGGTRSTYGPQTLSSRRSGPSFSFGTGPARAPPALEVDLGMLRAGLLPAASVNTRASTPGPIYKPQPTRKWLGDGPRPSFGSQEQRPASLGSLRCMR